MIAAKVAEGRLVGEELYKLACAGSNMGDLIEAVSRSAEEKRSEKQVIVLRESWSASVKLKKKV